MYHLFVGVCTLEQLWSFQLYNLPELHCAVARLHLGSQSEDVGRGLPIHSCVHALLLRTFVFHINELQRLSKG